MIAVEIQPSEGALGFGARIGGCSSHRNSDAPLAAHTVTIKLLHAKQYPGSRRTVCNITHDSDVMSNKICTIDIWAGLARSELQTVTEGFNTANLMIAENQY